jgi:putative acetyltransferase
LTLVSLAVESPDQPEVRALIDALDAYQAPLYPPASNHLLDIAALLRPEVIFVVARDASGGAIGCGAVVMQPGGWGEIKRMFVQPAVRGSGLAAAMLARLETEAAARGATELRLETGVRQPAALAFYARTGYLRCKPFGNYTDDPLSVFMRRPLTR